MTVGIYPSTPPNVQVERIGHIPKSRVSKPPVAGFKSMESLKSRKMVLTSKLSEKQGSDALVVIV